MYVKEFTDGKEEIESLQERITGRFSCETIKDKDGNVLVKANHMITPKRAAKIMSEGVNAEGKPYDKIKIRTILSCKCKVGSVQMLMVPTWQQEKLFRLVSL